MLTPLVGTEPEWDRRGAIDCTITTLATRTSMAESQSGYVADDVATSQFYPIDGGGQ
jgi:hypothetical protein